MVGPNLDAENEREDDPEEFDRSKVPDGPLAEFFFDMRTGRGLTNAEWDKQMATMDASGYNPFRQKETS